MEKYAAGIEDEHYNDESTYIHTFLAKLAEPEWQQDIDLLGVRPLIAHLIQAQQAFEELQRSRSVTTATKSEILAATKQRKELEKAIRAFKQYIEAMDLVNPAGVWHELDLTIRQQLEEIERGHRTGNNPTPDGLDKD